MKCLAMVTSRRGRFFASVSIENGALCIAPLIGLSVSGAVESLEISSLESVRKESRWKVSPFRLLPYDLISIKTKDGMTIRIDGPRAYRLANELSMEMSAVLD